jgi:MHS family shikimate/dehydroshikimate transporter-like MFS transporter
MLTFQGKVMQNSADIPQSCSIRRIAFASFIGTAVDWYDFYLYGTTAALVFPKLFFPQLSAFSAILASFGTFGVAFVARPVGGILFGHFGDRIGRKSMLVLTLMLMGSATFLIGLVPTFNQAGYVAPALLILLRFLQGLAVGGEWGGATLMVVEHAPEKTRYFYAAWPQTGAAIGLLLSSGVFAAFSALPDEQFFTWGWRVPFLLSIVLVAVGLFIRLRIVESPVFARIKHLGIASRAPVIEVLRDHPVAIILAIGVSFVIFVETYIINTFVLSYATGQIGVARGVMLTGLVVASLALFSGSMGAGMLAARFGTRAVALTGALMGCLLAFPFFWLIDTGSPLLIWIAMGLLSIGDGLIYGVSGALTAELFPARLRYSGISFSQQMAGLPGGALTPLIAAALVNWSGGKSWPVAAYLAVGGLLSFTAIYFAAEKYRVSITDPTGSGFSPLPQPQPA